VRLAKPALSFCAAWPLDRANPEEEELVVEEEEAEPTVFEVAGLADDATGGAAATEEEDVEEDPEEDPELAAPGFFVRSTSCVPSAMGPLGLAGHDPAGLRAAFCPRGIVPAAPTAIPPTKVVADEPWN